MKKCSFVGCEKELYSHGLCSSHRMQLYRGIALKPIHKKINRSETKCIVDNCSNVQVSYKNGYCAKHNVRFLKHGDVNKRNKGGFASKGLADYPDHYLFKKNRIIKIEESQHCCSLCGKRKKFLHVHHIDGGKTNHSLKNLMVLCVRCHWKTHGFIEDSIDL